MQYYVGLYHTGPSVGSLGLGLGNWLRRRCEGISGVRGEWYVVVCRMSVAKLLQNASQIRRRNILVTRVAQVVVSWLTANEDQKNL